MDTAPVGGPARASHGRSRHHPAKTAAFAGALAIVLCAVVVAAAGRHPLRLRTHDGTSHTDALWLVAIACFVVLCGIGAAGLGWALTDQAHQRRVRPRTLRDLLAALLTVAAAVLFLVMLARHHQPEQPSAATVAVPPAGTTAVHSPQGGGGGPGAAAALAIALAAVVAAVVAFSRLRAAPRRGTSAALAGAEPVSHPQHQRAAQAGASAVDDALAALERADTPRAAVIAAYAHLLAALAEHGLDRRPPETPRQHLARCLDAAPAAELDRLVALFEMARFGEHGLTELDRREAVRCLTAISAALGAPPSRPYGAPSVRAAAASGWPA